MTRMQHTFAALLALAAVAFMGTAATANDFYGGGCTGGAACCDDGACCGANQGCQVACGEAVVKVKCFACKCEDFCIPGPSCRDCKHCDTVCADGCCADGCTDGCAGGCTTGCTDGCCGGAECGSDCGCGHAPPQACPKQFVWWSWIPGTAQVHTKKKLMMKVVKKKVPVHTWNLSDCGCGGAGCGACGGAAPAAPSMGTPTPAGDEDMLPPAPPPVTRRAPVSQIQQTSGVLNYYE